MTVTPLDSLTEGYEMASVSALHTARILARSRSLQKTKAHHKDQGKKTKINLYDSDLRILKLSYLFSNA